MAHSKVGQMVYKQDLKKAVKMDILMVLSAVDSKGNNLAVRWVAIRVVTKVVWRVAVKAFFSVEMTDMLMVSLLAEQLVSEMVVQKDVRRAVRKVLRS